MGKKKKKQKKLREEQKKNSEYRYILAIMVLRVVIALLELSSKLIE